MIDLDNLAKYRENNRIEAKKALGGFPHSLWETYSAFANTLGGIILLGVEEHKDHSLHAVNLPAPEKLVSELWDTLNDPAKVSVNILLSKHVCIETVDDKRIIVITVPRVQRYDKPVYIGGNALGGTYRRNGEGDYKCTTEEIEAMLRDAAVQTPDMRILESFGLDALDYDSVHRYRRLMENCRPEHVLLKSKDNDFLYKLGAAGRSKDGILHPTAAGLLMFGNKNQILKEFPYYSLNYKDSANGISSDCGNWSGNIFDFYSFVRKKLVQNIAVPLSTSNGKAVDAAPVYKALCEALANCLINADYYGKQGIEIAKSQEKFTFSNPGSFRINVEKARTGGVSDPRNGALVKLFNLVGVGDGTGSGIPQIFTVWERHGWLTPSFSESFDPERITLSLTIGKAKADWGANMPEITPDDNKSAAKSRAKSLAQKAAIIEYLTDHTGGTVADISKLLEASAAQTERLLADLIASDIVVYENDVYRLKW